MREGLSDRSFRARITHGHTMQSMYRLVNFTGTCKKMQGRKRNSDEMTSEVLNTERVKKAHLDLSGGHSGDTGEGSSHGPDGHNTTQLRRIHGRHRDGPPKGLYYLFICLFSYVIHSLTYTHTQ